MTHKFEELRNLENMTDELFNFLKSVNIRCVNEKIYRTGEHTYEIAVRWHNCNKIETLYRTVFTGYHRYPDIPYFRFTIE